MSSASYAIDFPLTWLGASATPVRSFLLQIGGESVLTDLQPRKLVTAVRADGVVPSRWPVPGLVRH